MKIEKITYSKGFTTGPFLQEKLGMDVFLDEGDTPEQAYEFAKSKAEQWHKEANPHLYQSVNLPSVQLTDYIPPPTVTTYYPSPPKEINLQDEKKLITIENAKTLEELASLKEGLPDSLRSAYMEKLKQLTSKTK